MSGDFLKMFGKGGGLVQAKLDNCVTIFRKCHHLDTQVILNLTCINIYNYPKHVEKKPMKRKEK
jgi:hypothetical protein